MGMFSNLMGKIFGRKDEETPTSEETTEAAADAPAAEAAPTPSPEAALEPVDVEKILTDMEAAHPEDLDWRRSIVDLMKLVGMDSSYGARKELALELGYSQSDIDSKGSAEMNMWLHKEVMKRFAENGGKVPDDLLD
ncbi:MAG: DUF3597 domain-containing protein [Verrucomicrobiota bacterium]